MHTIWKGIIKEDDSLFYTYLLRQSQGHFGQNNLKSKMFTVNRVINDFSRV